MPVSRTHTLACTLASLLLGACAASPPPRAVEAASPAPERTAQRRQTANEDAGLVSFAGSARLTPDDGDDDSLVASDFSLGIDDLLSYRASWSVESGDILAAEPSRGANAPLPTRFAGQHLGQELELDLPELAGAPLSLAASSEFRNDWMVSGSAQSQRERASLSWSPGRAKFDVLWAGTASLADGSTALNCDLQSSMKLPTHQGSDHSEALRIYGRDCVVAADGKAYAGIAAHNWGLGYVWNRPRGQSEAVLSVIDPEWTRVLDFTGVGPGYELGISHRRDFGSLSAKALVSWRQAPGGELPADLAEHAYDAEVRNLAANASLTWHLPEASVSASWAKGVDRLWFTPDPTQRGDRFGLAVNFSRWMEALLPEASPQLAMNWNWSEVRLNDAEVIDNNSLRLDIALMF